jgi:hypothetical protein
MNKKSKKLAHQTFVQKLGLSLVKQIRSPKRTDLVQNFFLNETSVFRQTMRVPDQPELPAQQLARRDGAAQREAASQRHHHLRHRAAERGAPLHRRQATLGTHCNGIESYYRYTKYYYYFYNPKYHIENVHIFL